MKNDRNYTVLVCVIILAGVISHLNTSYADYRTKEQINVIAFSTDGLTIASGDSNGKVQLRNGKTLESHKTIAQLKAPIMLLAYSRNGKFLASSTFNVVDVTNIHTGKLIHQFKHQSAASIALSPDGQTLAVGGFGIGSDPVNRSIRLWDTKTGRLRKTLTGHHHTVHSVAFSSDGKELASADKGGMVNLWDLKTGQSVVTLPYKSTYRMATVTFVAGNKLLATIMDNFVDSGYATGGPIFRFVQTRPIDEDIRLWNVRTKEHIMTLQTHEQTAHDIAISHNGLLLASAGVQKDIKLWDLSTGKLLRQLKTPEGYMTSLRFSPDNKRIVASFYSPNSLEEWDITKP